MGRSVATLCGIFSQAIKMADGGVLAKLLAGNAPMGASDQAELDRELQRGDWSRSVSGFRDGWEKVVEGNLGYRSHLLNGAMDEAFEQQCVSFSAFVQCFAKSSSNWLVPAMNAIASKTRAVARQLEAHVEKVGVGVPGDALKTSAELMRKAWNACIRQKDMEGGLSRSKKLSALHVVNLLLQIYFERKEVRHCKHFITVVNHSSFPSIEYYPLPQRVTYKYFLGRLHMFEDQYVEAEKVLVEALSECTTNPSAKKNRRLIIQSLVLVRCHVGKLPRPGLLDKYGITPVFGPVVEAVRTGNVRIFHKALREYRSYFIRAGLYLVVSRLETLVYRTLFKKVCLITGGSRVPLTNFVVGLGTVGVKSDVDEVACIVSNLIYQKLALGYVAYKPQLVVIRATKAFPGVNDVVMRAAR